MPPDYALLLSLALLGIADVWCERKTDKSIIEWVEIGLLFLCRFVRMLSLPHMDAIRAWKRTRELNA